MDKIIEEKERLAIIFNLIEHLVKMLKRCLGENLFSVVLYGSYTRGQSSPESDVDLLIIADGLPASSLERQSFFTRILAEVEAPLRKALKQTGWYPYISAILKTPQEADCVSRIYFDMIDEARIFFDKGGFFASVLEKVKKRLEELGAKRVRVGKMWYWDLKPDYRPGEIFEI
jgi:predicted nucleotidyltransferase